MSSEMQLPTPSPEQKGRIYGMLTMGCDWETVARYLGFTADQLREETKRDAEFRREVVRAEAASDLHQIRNVYQACQEPNNWRGSTWWLERTSPLRFAKRPASAVTQEEWQEFLESIAKAITEEVSHDLDCQRLQRRLASMTYALQIRRLDDNPDATEEDETEEDCE